MKALYGWTPLRTPTSTLWFTPAGQVVEVPHHDLPPPGSDHDLELEPFLPDADQLHELERAQLQPPEQADQRPFTHTDPEQKRRTDWTWLLGSGRDAAGDEDADDVPF